MQFTSFVFILLFLPITLIAYFWGNRLSTTVGKMVIIAASVIFYACYGKAMLLILGISILINYMFALLIRKTRRENRVFLILPVLVNIGLLLFFKYLNFLFSNLNYWFGCELPLKELILPVGISFFTFQQIAYLAAVYQGKTDERALIDYLAYILYFPKILMGPLIEPVDFISQLNDSTAKKVNWDNIASGVKMFSFGLFKKLMIADVFANAVSWGYTNMETATATDWILVMLFYTLEIYFDFSGYSDMAVGTSLMLNITLPMNFDSPYKALSIRDFWKRWHISLTGFFTKYIYIPLGGSRKGKLITYANTMIVFLISGIWHGANYTFILWGLIHGVFMIFDRIAQKAEEKIVKPVRWCLTFLVVSVLWLLFRSDSITQWLTILQTILRGDHAVISDGLIAVFSLPETAFLSGIFHLDNLVEKVRGFWVFVYLVVPLGICLIPENNYRSSKHLSVGTMLLAAAAFVLGFICLSSESVFIYLNF